MKTDAASSSPLKAIFVGALRLSDSTDRQSYLEQACGDDGQLRREVDELLASRDGESSNPLDQAVEQFQPAQTSAIDQADLDMIDVSSHPMIGPYKLLERLGEGGMGAVYMAQQKTPVRRKVALKLIKPGMDSKEVIARFEAERQALAMMDHSNIARIFDGGLTEQGRPYFVMELVLGLPIDEYCDRESLSLKERLKQFVDVCRAIQHAHQKGIIHRDLKPSNIMITPHDGAPAVKVIDFGIAKALDHELTERTLFTRAAELIGTPAYMSPEQAELNGRDVDTRSDVYSLGVLLYKLLAGVAPFDEKTLKIGGLDEMRRIIREDDPPRPSRRVSMLENELVSTISDRRRTDPRELSLSMQRELDWVVMKALEKDRNRRYESANDLALDIQRYLDGDLVKACPPTMSYRLKKYAKRNKVLLTTAGLLMTTLFVATGVSVFYAVQADQERQQADAARGDAEERKDEAIAAKQLADQQLVKSRRSLSLSLQAIDRMLTRVSQDVANIPTLVRRGLLEDALDLSQNLLQENPSDARVRFQAGKTRWFLFYVYTSLGETAAAIRTSDEEIVEFERLLNEDPTNTEFQEYLASAYLQQSTIAMDPAAGRKLCRKAIALLETLPRNYTKADCDVSLANAYNAQAHLLRDDDPTAATDLIKRAIKVCESDPSIFRGVLGQSYQLYGKLLWSQGSTQEGEDAYRNAISTYREALSNPPARILPETQRWFENCLARCYREIAQHLREEDTPGQAEPEYLLAMAEHHLGHEQRARAQLASANEFAKQELAESPSWNRKMTLELLRKEAEALIGKPEKAGGDDTSSPVDDPVLRTPAK